MNCPKCGSKTVVEGTLSFHQRIMRRRACKKCGNKFETKEIPSITTANTQEVISKP